jgi:ribosomal protein S18 acetylase RimI-like enzyme
MPEDGRPPPGSGFVIREARSTDIDALARIEADRFVSDRLSRRSLAALSNSPSACVLVLSSRNRPVGYAVVLTRRGGRSARLYSIAVMAEESGRGAGSRLLAAAEEAARKRGAARVHLEVRADNPSAVSFYQRSGYLPIGERPGYYQDGMTALLFARDVSRSERSSPRSRRLSRAA